MVDDAYLKCTLSFIATSVSSCPCPGKAAIAVVHIVLIDVVDGLPQGKDWHQYGYAAGGHPVLLAGRLRSPIGGTTEDAHGDALVDKLVKLASLLNRGARGPAHGAGALGRDIARCLPAKPADLLAVREEVPRLVERHERRVEVEEQRRIELASVNRDAGVRVIERHGDTGFAAMEVADDEYLSVVAKHRQAFAGRRRNSAEPATGFESG